MAKYYVSSGEMYVVCTGENPADAILRALNFIIGEKGQDIELQRKFNVSERGFSGEDTETFDTDDVLSGLDWDWEDK
jgi:hypothetical protein|tara:strand:+ start:284 stop:514 length:231 start_codon:yes stop_codon:yes gene_type:complete